MSSIEITKIITVALQTKSTGEDRGFWASGERISHVLKDEKLTMSATEIQDFLYKEVESLLPPRDIWTHHPANMTNEQARQYLVELLKYYKPKDILD